MPRGPSSASASYRRLTAAGHGLLWPALLLCFATWVVALAGLSATQRHCSDDQLGPDFKTGASIPVNACESAFRWVWWILWVA
jgi:hypothetical protein